MAKVTLSNVFKKAGLEIFTYINKKDLTDNEVIFCILKVEKVSVPNSKFNISEQWQLTIAVPTDDGTVRKYWLTFTPNEVRDEFFTALQLALEEAYKNKQQAVHSCILQAVPMAEYDNPFYALNITEQECSCGLDV